MENPAFDRRQLAAFLKVSDRGLSPVLRRLGLPPRSHRFGRGLVWKALGLSPDQDPADWDDLSAPLLKAAEVARILGVDSSTVYKWHDAKPARPGYPPMPRAIDLGCGAENTRGLRWRRAEINAWDLQSPIPQYCKPAPVFGSLLPTS
jgi:predicted DNA-binding transcriptional regulator AlpA